MINLLNPEEQKQIRAARLNVRLVRFTLLSLVVAIGVVTIYGVGFWLARNDRSVAERENEISKTKLTKYEGVAKEAATYRQNLTTAGQILGTGMTFSKFLTDMGALMPANTILDGVNVSTNASGTKSTGIFNFVARAKSYNDILNIKSAFEHSSLLSDVKIVRTSVPDKPAEKGIAAAYPYEATLQVTVNALKGTTK